MTYTVFTETEQGVSENLKSFNTLSEAKDYYNKLLNDLNLQIIKSNSQHRQTYKFYTIRVNF